MKNKNNEIKETISYALLGILLAFATIKALGFVLSTDMPIVAVESNSMKPTFQKGDILLVVGSSKPADYRSSLKIGDIIVFSVPERRTPIVHRIVQLNPDGTFQTMGDNNHGRQLPYERHIRPEQIHGKVVFIIPYIGWIKIGTTEYILPNIWVVVPVILTIIFLYFAVQKYR